MQRISSSNIHAYLKSSKEYTSSAKQDELVERSSVSLLQICNAAQAVGQCCAKSWPAVQWDKMEHPLLVDELVTHGSLCMPGVQIIDTMASNGRSRSNLGRQWVEDMPPKSRSAWCCIAARGRSVLMLNPLALTRLKNGYTIDQRPNRTRCVAALPFAMRLGWREETIGGLRRAPASSRRTRPTAKKNQQEAVYFEWHGRSGVQDSQDRPAIFKALWTDRT